MGKYIFKKALYSLFIIFGVSLVIFTIIQYMPGNPYQHMVEYDTDPDLMEKRLTELGYYDPIPVQYKKWVQRTFNGDLGYSVHHKAPVKDLVFKRFKNTAILALVSFIISSFVAISIGIISAIKEGSKLDYLITVLSFIGVSIPGFFFALLLIKWLSLDLGLFPPSGMATLGKNFTGVKKLADIAKHMAMPVMVLVITQSASLIRHTRSSMLNVIDEDYIKTARSKGLRRNKAITIHGIKNALTSITTLLFLRLPDFLSGALIVETIFIWPGIGSLNYEAILNQDYFVVMGVTMLLAVIVVLCNLFADILYVLIDPRVKFEN